MKLQPSILSLAALAWLSFSSCQYVGDRALDLLDPYRVSIGAGTTIGARTEALGLYDTGLMLGVKPKLSSLGWRYGRPLFFDQTDERVDADQAEIIKTTSVIDLDTGDGSYRSAKNSFALLPAVLTWADSTPKDIDWHVPETGGDYDDRIWLWSGESFSRNRYAQIHAFDIELDVAIGIYVDIGFSPGEAIDFLLGFVLIDIAADDDRF